jgi:uncharacterized caspase-like protein
MDGTRSALIVASDDYTDPGLRRLRAPASDAQALAAVLQDPEIGGFQVRTLLNEPAHQVSEAVEEFFADRRPDDLLLVHFSCHGVKDESGELYFATANTKLRRLGATAVAAEFVNRRMSRSRSRRVVLLLDCCYAGAFERGMTARAGTGVGIEEQFGGRGRAVITASSAMEYAFEGDELADARELAPSVFTSALVEGLETGEADRDQDGMVALDELYDYVYDKVRAATPNQTPGKWAFGVQGELVIARRARPVTTPAPLPPELEEAVGSPFAGVRAGAVQELQRMLPARHAGLALAARLALERLTEDDSRMVAAAATAALGTQAAPAPPQPAPAQPAPPQPAPPEPAPPVPEPPATVREPVRADPTPPAASAPPPTRPPAARAAPEPARPVPRQDAQPRARDDRWLPVAGVLAIAAAVLQVASLLPPYKDGARLAVYQSWSPWFVVIVSAAALGAGACTLHPRTRPMIGPGLLLGVAASSTWGLVFAVAEWREGALGAGFWLGLAAGLLLVLAACLAGVVRAAEVHLVPGLPDGPLPWLVALLGVAGAVALLLYGVRLHEKVDSTDLPPAALSFGWVVLLAPAVPILAAVLAPRRFGVALLLGWVGGGVAIFSSSLGFLLVAPSAHGVDISRGPVVAFGLTLLALLVVAALLARDATASERETVARG